MTRKLSVEQVAGYARDGYVSPIDAFSPGQARAWFSLHHTHLVHNSGPCHGLTHGWDRATPMALFLSIIHPMSAIGVARSQQ